MWPLAGEEVILNGWASQATCSEPIRCCDVQNVAISSLKMSFSPPHETALLPFKDKLLIIMRFFFSNYNLSFTKMTP